MRHILRIEWMPNSPTGKAWWVYSYPCDVDGMLLKGESVPTANIVGQFETVEQAQAAYPNAQLYEVPNTVSPAKK